MAAEGFEKYGDAILEEAVRFSNEVAAELQTGTGSKVWTNYLFDLPGPRVLHRKVSPPEELFRFVFYGFNEIAETYEHLQDFEVYMRRFPYQRSRISNPRHLSHTIETYLNEVYVLQQRLLSYGRRVRRYAEKRTAKAEVSAVADALERMVLTAFKGIVRTRGTSVHEARYKDDDVSRLGTLDLLVNHGHMSGLKGFYTAETGRIRRKWQTTIRNNNREIKRLLNLYFSALHPYVFGPKVRLVGN